MQLLNRIFRSRSDPVESADSLAIVGEWEGHYTQQGDRRPIKATFVQRGNRVSGTMIDVETETDRSLYEATAAAGLPPGADETIDALIRRCVADASHQPIRAKSILPEQSKLDGIVDGSFIRFIKVYQGLHFIGYEVGDKRIGRILPGHSVQYSGRLSSNGRTIEGNWTIHDPEAPEKSAEGTFILCKVEDDPR